MIDLSKCAVVVGGVVDLEATLENVASTVQTYNDCQASDFEAVGAAVNAVFDQYKGAFINSKALGTLVLGILKPASLDAMTALAERVVDFTKANSGEGGSLRVVKSKGVCRVADQTATTK